MQSTPTRGDAAASAPDRSRRIAELDALRGFALAGIVMVNIVQLTGMPWATGPSREHPDAYLFELLFFQRPFLIFSLLFGVSLAIFLRTAARRAARPRLVLVRRLLWLAVFGALHTLLQPGEVLKFYAVAGLLVLPATYLSRRWLLWLGAVLTAAGSVLIGGVATVPGLFLLGMALTGYGIPDTLDRRGRQLAVALAVAVPLATAAAVLQYRYGVGPQARVVTLQAGLAVAFLYVTGFLLLLRTPLGRPLGAVFAPMGKLALTNYILATVLILAADPALGIGERTDYALVVAVGAGIGVIQAAWSPIWLRWFQYGPLEWLWRCLTWWQWVPIRTAARVGR
jgi:uncharacterized membrane protein YeiB